MNIFPGGESSRLFNAFLAPETDRLLFLQRLLTANGVPCTVVKLKGLSHLIVRFDGDAYNSFFRIKTLVAHYDREEVPGANDNSAACFQLAAFAVKLLNQKDHNIRIVFSGAEEAGARGVAQQGAFALGLGLRKLKLENNDIFVLDACGRGDTLILSTTGLDSGGKKRPRAFVREREALFRTAAELAQKSCPNRWLSLPTPYSDNAGLAAAGIPAQLVTVLPHEEAQTLAAEMLRRGIPARTAISAPARALADGARHGGKSWRREKKGGFWKPFAEDRTAAFEQELISFSTDGDKARAFIPRTWLDMHGGGDSAEKLTPAAFQLVGNFLDRLAAAKTPC